MKYSIAKPGRIFVVRLEDGDILHEQIEELARRENITAASCVAVGGIDAGSTLIVGPADGRAEVMNPMPLEVDNVREIAGTGTIFPDEDGNPVLHMHIACGRKDHTVTGCVRSGVKVWQVMEVIIHELTGCNSRRVLDEATGFKLLQP